MPNQHYIQMKEGTNFTGLKRPVFEEDRKLQSGCNVQDDWVARLLFFLVLTSSDKVMKHLITQYFILCYSIVLCSKFFSALFLTTARDLLVPWCSANYIVYFRIKITIPALEVTGQKFTTTKSNRLSNAICIYLFIWIIMILTWEWNIQYFKINFSSCYL